MESLLPCGKLWSANSLKATQYWQVLQQEFNQGLDRRIALRGMKDQFGPAWRSNALWAKNVPGSEKLGGSYKVGW